MPTKCFMVVPVNERRWTEMVPEEKRCDDPACEHCTTPQEHYLCDIRREDTYEIIITDSDHFPPFGGRELPPGAMYFKDLSMYGHEVRPGDYLFSEGPNLHVTLPNGVPWNIDSRASNCGLPDDMEHRCWVREGDPPMVTISKDGLTCDAGAGSIRCGDYHGFLINGELTDG